MGACVAVDGGLRPGWLGEFQDVFSGHIGPHRVPRPRGWELVFFIGGKVVSLGLVLVIPLFFHPVWVVALFYLFVAAIMGVLLAIVFQLAHCVEEAEFPTPEEGSSRISRGWAEHQVETTVNFSRKSRVLSWLL